MEEAACPGDTVGRPGGAFPERSRPSLCGGAGFGLTDSGSQSRAKREVTDGAQRERGAWRQASWRIVRVSVVQVSGQ